MNIASSLVSIYSLLTFCVTLMAAPDCPKCINTQDKRVNQGLDMRLISESSTIQAGVPFRLGLHIKHQPGFHTYWKNPGLVGVPTSIKWTLPEGFTASSMVWPYPERSKMAQYPCYGYERDVLLVVTITPPKSLLESTVSISAKTHWMCCSEKQCFPGYHVFELELPTGKPVLNPQHESLFKQAEHEVPVASNGVEAKMLTAIDDEIIRIKFHFRKDMGELIHVFSEDGQTTPDLGYTIKELGAHRYEFTAPRSPYSPKHQRAFPCVIQLTGGIFKASPRY